MLMLSSILSSSPPFSPASLFALLSISSHLPLSFPPFCPYQSGCGYSIGRHSKSLDTKAKICGKCHGTFECRKNLDFASGGGGTPRGGGMSSGASTPGAASTPVTPRTPNKFALFVKDNYASTKKGNADLKHGDIMKLLGKEFSEKMKV